MGTQGKAVASIYFKCKVSPTPRWRGFSSLLIIYFLLYYYRTVIVDIGPVIQPTGMLCFSSNPSLISRSLDSSSTTFSCCSRVPYICPYSTPWASRTSSLLNCGFNASQKIRCDWLSTACGFEHFKRHLRSSLYIEEK